MKIEYRFSFADYKAALRLHAKQTLYGRISPYIYLFVLISSILGAFWVSGHDDLAWLASIFAGGIGGGTTGVILILFYRPFMIRKSFKQCFPPSIEQRFLTLEFNDEHFVSEISGVGKGDYQWDSILKVVQNEKCILFYIAVKKFIILPPSAISPDQRVELNDLIARHVTNRSK